MVCDIKPRENHDEVCTSPHLLLVRKIRPAPIDRDSVTTFQPLKEKHGHSDSGRSCYQVLSEGMSQS